MESPFKEFIVSIFGSAILGNYHDCQRNTTLLDVTLAPSQHACSLLVARLFFP